MRWTHFITNQWYVAIFGQQFLDHLILLQKATIFGMKSYFNLYLGFRVQKWFSQHTCSWILQIFLLPKAFCFPPCYHIVNVIPNSLWLLSQLVPDFFMEGVDIFVKEVDLNFNSRWRHSCIEILILHLCMSLIWFVYFVNKKRILSG